ncbi:MAG: tRNA 2-thiouridine(34) synthase MnmA [Bacteroidales bacterium]
MTHVRKTVLIAMSGGIDSSVAALLLQKDGYSVEGLFISFFNSSWVDPLVIEQQQRAMKHVESLCSYLHIPFHHIDVSRAFYDIVISYFVSEYASGKTPFPCAICNPQLKWKTLCEMAENLNISHIATGHYNGIETKNNVQYITQGVDSLKDQSFFLWGLPQSILVKTIFPLAHYTKKEVYKIAQQCNITSADTKESTGICFLPDKNYRPFIVNELSKRNTTIPNGKFIDIHGAFLGHNDGYIHYTVGQRKHLGVNFNKRMFVHALNSTKNTVTLSDYSSLYKKEFYVHNFYFHTSQDIHKKLIVKIRYREQAHECTIEKIDTKKIRIILAKPLNSIAPGQTAVFYDNRRVVGGGFIV